MGLWRNRNKRGGRLSGIIIIMAAALMVSPAIRFVNAGTNVGMTCRSCMVLESCGASIPARVTGVRAVRTGDGSVRVSWKRTAGVSRYQIAWRKNGAKKRHLKTAAASARGITIHVPGRAMYRFRVRAQKKHGSRYRSGRWSRTVTAAAAERAITEKSRLENMDYKITYRGKEYSKTAVVYVPPGYDGRERMNVLYLMHGSGGDAVSTADTMRPLFDRWIAAGEMDQMIVVFPTYYPDRSFVTADYTSDYPLNHFFAGDELPVLVREIDRKYQTYGTGDHRAFGGYSMGGVTTWDVIAANSRLFSWYMPMAGDCWLGRVTDADSDSEIADMLADGLRSGGHGPDDFHIIAMVGGSDGTKYSMQPQIRAMRDRAGGFFTEENLRYWENRGGGHSQASFEAETRHGIRYLFK
jgi:enterochelin esterase-like enzyme